MAADALRVLFRALPFRELTEGFSYVDANRLVPYEKLTAETACYWRHLAAFLVGEGGGAAELAEQKLLPELSDFCRYLRHYVLEIERPDPAANGNADKSSASEGKDKEEGESWTFVAKQLIEMTSLFDLADEVGRANLAQLCKDLMSSPRVAPGAAAGFIEPLMSVFAAVRTDTEGRIREVAEIIAELRDPLRAPGEDANATTATAAGGGGGSPGAAGQKAPAVETTPAAVIKAREEENRRKQIEIAKVRVRLNILKNDLDEAVQNKDFVRAQELKMEMEELDDDYNRLQEELTEAAAMAAKPSRISNASEVPSSDKEATAEAAEDKEAEEGSQQTQSAANDDPVVVLKCLEILYQLMQDTAIKTLNATLLTLLDELVMPSVRHLESDIRMMAVKAIGVFSLRSISVAKQNLLLLFQVLKNYYSTE